MAEVNIQVKNDVFEYIKSLNDYSVCAEEQDCLVIERSELSDIKIVIMDNGEELLFSVNLCPTKKIQNKLEKVLSLNPEILPASLGIEGDSVILFGSLFTENLDENEIIGTLMSICNGIETFAEEILEN